MSTNQEKPCITLLAKEAFKHPILPAALPYTTVEARCLRARALTQALLKLYPTASDPEDRKIIIPTDQKEHNELLSIFKTIQYSSDLFLHTFIAALATIDTIVPNAQILLDYECMDRAEAKKILQNAADQMYNYFETSMGIETPILFDSIKNFPNKSFYPIKVFIEDGNSASSIVGMHLHGLISIYGSHSLADALSIVLHETAHYIEFILNENARTNKPTQKGFERDSTISQLSPNVPHNLSTAYLCSPSEGLAYMITNGVLTRLSDRIALSDLSPEEKELLKPKRDFQLTPDKESATIFDYRIKTLIIKQQQRESNLTAETTTRLAPS